MEFGLQVTRNLIKLLPLSKAVHLDISASSFGFKVHFSFMGISSSFHLWAYINLAVDFTYENKVPCFLPTCLSAVSKRKVSGFHFTGLLFLLSSIPMRNVVFFKKECLCSYITFCLRCSWRWQAPLTPLIWHSCLLGWYLFLNKCFFSICFSEIRGGDAVS